MSKPNIETPPKGLTDAFIRALPFSKARYEVTDKQCNGLCVRVGATSKTFVWYYKDRQTNKQTRQTLGTYGVSGDHIGLSDARIMIDTLRDQHKNGTLNSQLTHSNAKTVKNLCEIYYKDSIETRVKRPDAILQALNHDVIPIIGHRLAKSITAPELCEVVQIVIRRGAKTHAGKVLAILKMLFKFAEARGIVDRSPAYALDKKSLGVVEVVRERCLEPEEFKYFWEVLDGASRLSLPTKDALKILLLTGSRTGELLKARWDNINFITREWLIPATDTKTNVAWIVPLSQPVITLLSELKGCNPDYVFAGKGGALSDKVLGRAVRRLFEAKTLTIEHFRPHDLRRTFRTGLEKYLNVEPHIAEKCLNHSLGSINAVYNKHTYLPERRIALDQWAEFVMLYVNPQENVIPFKNVI